MKKKNFSKLFFLGFASLLMCSCSKELKNDKARDLIEKFYGLPKTEKRIVNLKTKDFLNTNNKVQVFVRNDLIALERTSSLWWGSGLKEYYYVLTPTGNIYACSDPYHYGEKDFGTGVGLQYGQDVRVCDIEFNSVTGIMSNEHNKSARVEFNLRRTNITPFGKCFGLNENDLINLSVNFAMYNDGWRLQPNDELKKVKRNLINKIVISDQSSDKTKQMAENNKTEQIDKNEMRPIAKTRKFKIDDHEPTTEEIESEKMIIDSIAKAKGINVSKDRCLVLIGNWNGVFVSNGSRKPIQPCKIVQDNNGVKFITGEYAISTNGSYLVFFNGKFRGQYTGMTGSSGVIPPATNFSITLDKEGKLLLTRVGDFPNRYYEYTRTK